MMIPVTAPTAHPTCSGEQIRQFLGVFNEMRLERLFTLNLNHLGRGRLKAMGNKGAKKTSQCLTGSTGSNIGELVRRNV